MYLALMTAMLLLEVIALKTMQTTNVETNFHAAFEFREYGEKKEVFWHFASNLRKHVGRG
jgi:hypothetical protein